MAFNEAAYKRQFDKENYEQVNFRVPKGKRDVIRKLSEEKGISANKLIISALEIVYHIDLSNH